MSKFLFDMQEFTKKIKRIIKKVKKVWKHRKEYFSKEYRKKKRQKEFHNKGMEIKSVSAINERDICNDRLAVYTCVFGNYDKIKEPLIKGKYCDYYIITDQDVSINSAWKKVDWLDYPFGFETWHPAIKNRYYKMHPHEVFKEYDYSLYIDGNVRPITDLYPLLILMTKSGKKMALYKHPIFNCLFDSSEHLKKINLVDHNTMELQISKYHKENFPENFGFFECNLILRKHTDVFCNRIMDTWWSEYQSGVKRDQQSFTYAIWKNNMSSSDICVLGGNIRESSRVKLSNHKRKHEKV